LEISKKIGILFIIGLLTIKSLVAPILFFDYELRKDFIIKNYCVNKSRPELHCDGKCYLAKQIQKTQKQDEQQATNQFLAKFFSTENSQLSTNLCIRHQLLVVEVENVQFDFYDEGRSFVLQKSFFHPPQQG
jgi:hypothetical protein